MGREGRGGKSLGVQRGWGISASGASGQWQYCTYVRVGGHRVITLDGVGLPTSQDHWPTNLGFGAIRDRGTFGRGLKQNKQNKTKRFARILCAFFKFERSLALPDDSKIICTQCFDGLCLCIPSRH